ncbi:MAG: hypothetical protein ABWZ69_02410 [Mycetocola sp.]
MAPTQRPQAFATVALAVSTLLSGCTFAGDAESSTTPAPPTPAASAAPTPKPTVAPPILDVRSVVATGRLVGSDSISGDVDVRVTGKGTFELRLIDFRSDHAGDVELRVSPHVVPPGSECTTSIMTMSYGNLPAETQQAFPLPKDFTHGNPSFLDTVIISHFDPVASQNGCYVPILSSAILTWTLPDLRPGLVVADTGKTGGATGDVTFTGTDPLAYTVARNDLAAEVAARFGITVSDVFYLNPTRLNGTQSLLQTGEVLNLSKAHR